VYALLILEAISSGFARPFLLELERQGLIRLRRVEFPGKARVCAARMRARPPPRRAILRSDVLIDASYDGAWGCLRGRCGH